MQRVEPRKFSGPRFVVWNGNRSGSSVYWRVRVFGSLSLPSQIAASVISHPSCREIVTSTEYDVTTTATSPASVAPSVLQPSAPDQISIVSLPEILFVHPKSSLCVLFRHVTPAPRTHDGAH